MDINWNKWIIEQLPLKLRTVLLFAYCKVLNSHTVKLHGEFVKWQKKIRIHAGATPQVCMIKKVVNDEMAINIQIEEGNGKPVDFIIKTSFADIDKERQLFALLDKYKLAGKTYAYENAEIILSAVWNKYACERGDILSEWQRYYCELSDVSYSWPKYICELVKAVRDSQWTKYVCEQKAINTITFTYYWSYDSGWGSTIVKRIAIQAEYPVKSELIIKCKLYLFGRHDQILEPEFLLHPGDSSFSVDSWVVDLHTNEHIVGSDEYYEYRLKVEDIYE